ncbi:MAG: tyrosine-type recombinase/integrase [Thermaerobacter sp.]|nr:tyrosine-type recombinase/integrase [Thermaerobacter sp.]
MTPDTESSHRITRQVEAYIAFKRGLGFQLAVEADELRRFAAFARRQHHEGPLTAALALAWAQERPHYTRWYQARRLEVAHRFAVYAQIQDVETEVPPRGTFGSCHGRTTPYLFTLAEVQQVMQAAQALPSPDGLRAQALSTAIGLLWATGLRPSELCSLMREDVNKMPGILHVRKTKFTKERALPLDATVVAALQQYAAFRDVQCRNPKTRHFFLSTGGIPLTLRHLEYGFTVIRRILLPPGESTWPGRAPRLYDLRHSFACATIQRWYTEGIDVNHHLLLLSTYLGHVKPSDTYWYLTGTPELLALATERFQQWAANAARKGGDH